MIVNSILCKRSSRVGASCSLLFLVVVAVVLLVVVVIVLTSVVFISTVYVYYD